MPTCFWCHREFGFMRQISRDHLIPIWACRLFPKELGREWVNHNIVKSCTSCNGAKGGMPPATFHRVRDQAGERKLASIQWHQIQQQACDTAFLDPTLRAYIIEEMLKPIPGYVVPEEVKSPLEEKLDRELGNPPFSKNKPLKRLYTLGAVPQNTVLSPLDYEKLNENLKGDVNGHDATVLRLCPSPGTSEEGERAVLPTGGTDRGHPTPEPGEDRGSQETA